MSECPTLGARFDFLKHRASSRDLLAIEGPGKYGTTFTFMSLLINVIGVIFLYPVIATNPCRTQYFTQRILITSVLLLS